MIADWSMRDFVGVLIGTVIAGIDLPRHHHLREDRLKEFKI